MSERTVVLPVFQPEDLNHNRKHARPPTLNCFPFPTPHLISSPDAPTLPIMTSPHAMTSRHDLTS